MGGTLADVVGILLLLQIQGRPAAEVGWATAAVVVALLIGGFVAFLAGIVLAAIGSRRQG